MWHKSFAHDQNSKYRHKLADDYLKISLTSFFHKYFYLYVQINPLPLVQCQIEVSGKGPYEDTLDCLFFLLPVELLPLEFGVECLLSSCCWWRARL